MKNDWVYDIETYMDIFCVGIVHVDTNTRFIFEVSNRVDLSGEFIRHIYWMKDNNARMFGYNNLGFDWPIIDHLLKIGDFTALDAHNKGNAIITGDRFAHTLWPSDILVTQGDLFKIHHFDNMARSTSLKKLEINMRSRNVIDLPYPPDQPTTSDQKDEIIHYMCHDVNETLKFYHYSKDQINFRDSLAVRYPDMGDILNMNDTKIGKKFFERELERAGTPCYHRPNGKKEPRQTIREYINVGETISSLVSFKHPEFQRILGWLKSQRIIKHKYDDISIKGIFKDVAATVDGFTYVFGTGGIHGSVNNAVIRSDDEWEIWDWDVASYYPNLAISNKLYPEHLSNEFCKIYQQVYNMRKEHAKGTAENAMLKLALNGVYGDSNNVYSPFYDTQYTLSITINGQLMLCMLAEQLRDDGIEMIQINTDGLTIKVRKDRVAHMKQVCHAWEKHTGLELESAQYKSMFVKDVNNYLAEKTNGDIKRIGTYAYVTPLIDPYTRERGWHQDHSMLVVRKAAEAAMIQGTPVSDFIMNHNDPMDFQLSVKVPQSSRLEIGSEKIQNTTRYYVTTDGESLTKVMPPLKGKTAERRIGVQSGWTVTVTNNMSNFRWGNINWYFYIKEAEKLVI